MKTAIHSYLVDTDGTIRTRITFYGDDDQSAELALDEHIGVCWALDKCTLENRVIEIHEAMDAFPDVAALREIEDAAGDGDEEEDEDAEDEEEEDDYDE